MGQKISAMGVAAALAGVDLLAVVQGGVTKKATIADVLTYAKGQSNTWSSAQAFGAAVTMALTLGVTGAVTLGSTLGVTGLATLTGGAVVGVAPTSLSTYGLGVRINQGHTTGFRYGSASEVLATPTGNTGGAYVGAGGYAESAATAFNLTSPTGGLVGGRFTVAHLGSGTLTAAVGLAVPAHTNTGGGTITNAIALYLADQTAGVNNYGLYQVGAGTVNYMAGRLGIGVTSPDSTVMLDLRAAATQLALGNAASRGYLGASTTAATHLTYGASHDGTDWVARLTGASIYQVSAGTHRWFGAASGLTAGAAFTPTQQMELGPTSAGATLWVAALPSLITSSSYAIGAMPTFTVVNNTRLAATFQAIANPTGTASGLYCGIGAIAATDASNAQNFTASTAGLRAGYFRTRHQGTGTVTGAAGVYVDTPTVDNQATGGAITSSYGIYIAGQAVTGITNVWGIWQNGSTTSNMFAGPLVLGTASGPTITSGSGNPEGSFTAPVGSLRLRTDGAPGSTLYAKTSGAGNTGWAAVA